MRVSLWYKGVLLAAALCVAPAAFPASPNGSVPRTPSVMSGDENFTKNASNMLERIQEDAVMVKDGADQLEAFTRTPFLIDWQSDGGELSSIRARVNDMDKELSQLRSDQSEALPWQRQAIDRIAPTVMNLTNTAQAAIVSLNQYQDNVFYSDVRGLAQDMSHQARLIDQTIGNNAKSARSAHQESSKTQRNGTNS